jgi:uncharacterized protein (DUF58 family)
VRLTRRGVAVLSTAAALLGSGWWLRYPLLAELGAAGLAAVAAALLIAGRGPRAEVLRTIRPDRVERGRPATAFLSVRPEGVPVEIRDTVAGRVHRVRTAGTAEYPLPTAVRGRFVVGPLEVGREDPLGLARGRRRTGGTATLVVHPRQLPARPEGGHSSSAIPGSAMRDLWRGTAEPRGVREYEPGDEVRHLHWKATAHTGRLMMRELADPRQITLTVLLDTRRTALSAADFEEAVDLAASLLGAVARAGVPARLFGAGGRELLGHFLDALAEVRQDDTETLVADGTGGRLVLITGGSPSPPGLGRTFTSVVVLGLGPGAGAEDGLRRWNEMYR